MTITAAADGSALGNPGPAGWAWYIDDNTWRAGGWTHGTNNMGELKAVLDLLEATGEHAGIRDQPLLVLCDSQYVINSVTRWMPGWKRKGWKKKDGKPVQNVELIKAIDAAIQGRSVDFEWVKGHAGHPMNEAADKLANGAATAFAHGRTPDTGPGLDGGTPVGSDSETTDPPAVDRAAERELALYTDAVRADRDAAAALLHADLTVIDADGRTCDRQGFLDSMKPLRGFSRVEVSDMVSTTPGTTGQDVVLVRYRTDGAYGSTTCTSVWVTEAAGSGGQLTLLHHQRTRIS